MIALKEDFYYTPIKGFEKMIDNEENKNIYCDGFLDGVKKANDILKTPLPSTFTLLDVWKEYLIRRPSEEGAE